MSMGRRERIDKLAVYNKQLGKKRNLMALHIYRMKIKLFQTIFNLSISYFQSE